MYCYKLEFKAKKIGWILFLSVWSIQLHAQTSNKAVSAVHFKTRWTWEQLKQQAQKEHKYIFVDCYATWCAPCKMMDEKTYTDNAIGTVANAKFLSVKLQCDQTKKDPVHIKQHYADANFFLKAGQVTAYPAFLFFSPDGRLVHKVAGFYPPTKFKAVLAAAQDPAKQYFTLINDYKENKLALDQVETLAQLARQNDNKILADSVTRYYIENYLDKLPDNAFFNTTHYNQISLNINAMNSEDKAFIWLLHHAKDCDTIQNKFSSAGALIEFMASKEEIAPQLKLAKQTLQTPSWDSISSVIADKFGADHVIQPVLAGKMEWYQFTKDWENYCQIGIERIELSHLLSKPGFEAVVNNHAYDTFMYSTDRAKLQKVLFFMTGLKGVDPGKRNAVPSYMDTKANLLYKLGDVKAAVALETKVVALDPGTKEFKVTLKKMHEGKPTW